MKSLLDNWLKNNHITVDKIHYLRSLFVFFTNFSFQIYFSIAEHRHKNRILWQLAKIRHESGISQSNGSIGRPLGFVIDRLNTSASLYRIAPCLREFALLGAFSKMSGSHCRRFHPSPHPLPLLLILPLFRSFSPVCEHLEKERKRLLRRLPFLGLVDFAIRLLDFVLPYPKGQG